MPKSIAFASLALLVAIPVMLLGQENPSDETPPTTRGSYLSDRLRMEEYIGLEENADQNCFEIRLFREGQADAILKTVTANRSERKRLGKENESRMTRYDELQAKIAEVKKRIEIDSQERLSEELDALISKASQIREEMEAVQFPTLSRYERDIQICKITQVGADYIELKPALRGAVRYHIPLHRIYRVVSFDSESESD